MVVLQATGVDSRHVRTAVLLAGCDNCTAPAAATTKVKERRRSSFFWVTAVVRRGGCWSAVGIHAVHEPAPPALPIHPRPCIVFKLRYKKLVIRVHRGCATSRASFLLLLVAVVGRRGRCGGESG